MLGAPTCCRASLRMGVRNLRGGLKPLAPLPAPVLPSPEDGRLRAACLHASAFAVPATAEARAAAADVSGGTPEARPAALWPAALGGGALLSTR